MIEDAIADAVSDFPELTRSLAALFVILRDAKGRFVTHSDIEVRLEEIMGYRSTRATIAGSPVKKLRKVLAPHGYRIENAYMVGYRMLGPGEYRTCPHCLQRV